uniref:Glutamate receptor ionotropic, delta-1 n=3 Tax=Cacopsylla melanoneura TaxID=428564 RepID=A0A8D8XAJ6_9HEMI
MQEKAAIGIAGMVMTNERMHNVSFSAAHSQDCAVFISLTSLALSKYRAIFGPFKWEVWVCLVLVYLLAIIPLSFSDKLTLRHLWEKPSEIENMFWYMFGTFTNLFTFRNTNSWTSSKKGSTRAFVGTYWVFSIIITAAYTGSIIAFITLPVFPETIDTLQQLKSERYRIITLDNSGWQKFNDTQKKTLEHSVFNNWELVPKVEDGLRNVTKGHLLWSYAFLGSKAQLEHIVKNNFENSG